MPGRVPRVPEGGHSQLVAIATKCGDGEPAQIVKTEDGGYKAVAGDKEVIAREYETSYSLFIY